MIKTQTLPKMNYKHIFRFLPVFLLATALGACSEDEAAVNETYAFGDYNGSLKDSNIYLGDGDYDYEYTNGEFTSRTYFISDGDFVEGGNPYDLNDYAGGTYNIQFTLNKPTGTNFTEGDFTTYQPTSAPANAKFCHIQIIPTPNLENDYFAHTELPTATINVEGGFEDGETITFKLSGELKYVQKQANNAWTDLGMREVSMLVTGKVVDIRS